MVGCGAQLTGQGPVRIGLPLDGWDLAVVDPEGRHVEPGADGELIIGGIGLARYLDPDKDAEKFAPMPTLGWPRAYRSGDLVRYDEEGLMFVGRADDQVKLGGRRIELGEIDSALLDAARGRRRGGRRTTQRRRQQAARRLRRRHRRVRPRGGRGPAPRPGCRPRWCRASRCRDLADADLRQDRPGCAALAGRRRARARLGTAARRAPPAGCRSCGARSSGPWSPSRRPTSSTSAAAASPPPSSCRGCGERFPEVTVADVYEHPTVGDLAGAPRRDGGPVEHEEPAGSTRPAEDPGRPAAVHRSAAHADRRCAG